MVEASEAFIIGSVRTPIAKHGGALRLARPDDLLAHVLRALVAKHQVPAAAIEEVFAGCANQAGEDNRNVARMAALLAGLPDTVPGVTVNRLCASGLEAVVQAARALRVGDVDLVLAGGVESMTRAPWSMPKPSEGFATGKPEIYDTSLGWRYPNPKLAEQFPLEQMGETAENVAEQHHISREDQDRFALSSHVKASAARSRLQQEIIAVELPQKKGAPVIVDADEGPRADSTLDKLAGLRPAFRPGGTVTAGNASTMNDGAAALLLASRRGCEKFGLTPIARVVASGAAGVSPRVMGLGPIEATKKALARAKLEVAEIDVWELNEAFAAQVLACQRALGFALERLNVNGGAIALGHPLGMSGARLAGTLALELHQRKVRYGVASLCVGVGQGLSVVLERVG